MDTNQPSPRHSSDTFDLIIIGAGVVGCAVARKFALEGARVVVLEKAADILDGASKGNSAILHTGFDAPPASVEHKCIVDGYRQFRRIRSGLSLPLIEAGALVLAWTADDAERLEGILRRAHENGVKDARLLGREAILQREPCLAAGVAAAIHVPGEAIIDPWTTPFTYLLQAVQNGAELRVNCDVLGGSFDGFCWQLETTRGPMAGRSLINCAGLYGDRVNQLLTGHPGFEIRPRKGQFLVYDKSASSLAKSILLPVPSETTKGIVICRTAFGNLLVGPTAEEQQSRHDASVNTATLESLRRKGESILPRLEQHGITATYAGIRPATEQKDYRIQSDLAKNYICVGGIRSTGLSAALGIAEYVFERYSTLGKSHAAPENIRRPSIPQICEYGERDWQRPGNGGIVCHCELVTRREIELALSGEIPARSLDGLKRRTRATMGRCQGFYCSAALSRLCRKQFGRPPAVQSHEG